ncbi:MAG: hypothetical protein LBJ74_05615 [Heliobacteriaceae bacterium]|jgi:hypothetical protein|nr:hypothetical protein [Heliobacteriaceae bacterium]
MTGVPRITGESIRIVRPAETVTTILTAPKKAAGKLKQVSQDVFVKPKLAKLMKHGKK